MLKNNSLADQHILKMGFSADSFGGEGGNMEKRIVRFEEGIWRIRMDAEELSDSEKKELIDYFDEIKLPYCLADGYLCIDGGVSRDAVFERLEHFYDGRAEVFPF